MDTYLGEFEHLVLLAVLRVGEEAYAVPVRAEIESRAGRTVARGALYTTLDRLEQKGLLTSRLGDPLPERGGRARRYYRVSSRGLAGLRAARSRSTASRPGSRSNPSGHRADGWRRLPQLALRWAVSPAELEPTSPPVRHEREMCPALRGGP